MVSMSSIERQGSLDFWKFRDLDTILARIRVGYSLYSKEVRFLLIYDTVNQEPFIVMDPEGSTSGSHSELLAEIARHNGIFHRNKPIADLRSTFLDMGYQVEGGGYVSYDSGCFRVYGQSDAFGGVVDQRSLIQYLFEGFVRDDHKVDTTGLQKGTYC